jgi:hypothetical protein
VEKPALEVRGEEISTDGRWRAVVKAGENLPPQAGDDAFPDGKYFVEMVVEQSDGDLAWPVLSEWRHAGLGQDYPQPLRWSADGRYLYYANVAAPDGCSILANGGDLWRIDLENGEVREIAPAIGLVMALSPDESLLAVNASYGRGFLIRDLESGIEQPLPLPEPAGSWAIAELQWSPDGEQLLLIQATNPCMPMSETAVVLVDAAALAVTTLVEAQERPFTIQEWHEDDFVLLRDKAGATWQLDLNTGEFSEFSR